MKLRRILSLLLSAVLVISGLPITAFAASTNTELPANIWTAKSGSTGLTVDDIDESGSGSGSSPNTTEYYHAYAFENSEGEDAIIFTFPNDAFEVGTKYKISVYMRSSAHVNADNDMTLRIIYDGADLECVDITDEWTEYTAEFTFGDSNYFAFQRDNLGEEDVVPFDIDGLSFTELDENGAEVGTAFPVDGEYSVTEGTSMLTVSKAEEVFGRVVIPTKEVNNKTVIDDAEITDFTVDLSNSSTDTISPGKYMFAGDFRLGWFDHEGDNTATLRVYNGSSKLGDDVINSDTWTTVSFELNIAADTPISQLKFKLGTVAPLDFKNIVIEPVGYASGDGSDIITVPGSTDEYIHVSGRDSGDDVICYEDNSTSYGARDTYKVKFKIRTTEYIASDDIDKAPAQVTIYGNGVGSAGRQLSGGKFKVSTTWVSKELTLPSGFNGKIYIYDTDGYGIAPFDIKDFEIIKTNGRNPGTVQSYNGLYDENIGAGWKIHQDSGNGVKSLRVKVASDVEYMSVASSNGVAELKYSASANDMLQPGIYEISADFRTLEIDYNKYDYGQGTTLVSDGNAVPLTLTVEGSTVGNATINPEGWTNVKFKVGINHPTPKNQIIFSAQSDISLAFANVQIEDKTELYEDIDYETGDGQQLIVATDGGEQFIRSQGRDSYSDEVMYRDEVTEWDRSKNYVISMKVRTFDYIQSDVHGKFPATYRIKAIDKWGSGVQLCGDSNGNYVIPTEWTTVSATVTNFNGLIYVFGNGNGYSMAPIDFKDLTIVEEGTTENLAKNANELYTQGAGWKIYSSVDNGVKTFEVKKMPESGHLIVPAATDGISNTSFHYTSFDAIEPGVYNISASFMLGDVTLDYNKYTYDTHAILVSDDNFAKLTASVGNSNLPTVEGAEFIKVNGEVWANVTYKLVVNDGDNYTMQDISFTLDTNDILYVKDLVFTDISSNFVGEWVSNGNANVEKVNDGEFYRTDAQEIGTNTTLSYTGEDKLSAGSYVIKGKFRLNAIEGSSAMISAKFSGEGLEAYRGAGTVSTPTAITINSEDWTTVAFLIKLDAEAQKKNVLLELDAHYSIEFCELDFAPASDYFSADMVGADGGHAVIVCESDDEQYIRVGGKDHGSEDIAAYKNINVNWDAEKSYTISFKIRTREFIASADSTVLNYPAMMRYSINNNRTAAAGSFTLTPTWQEYSATVTNFQGIVCFYNQWQGKTVAPHDIKDFSIVEVGTTENLAENANGLYTNGAGWYIYKDGGSGLKQFEVTAMPRDPYYLVSAPATGNTSLGFEGTDTLAPGVYHISGKFMLQNDIVLDYNNYTFNGVNLSSDANGANLTLLLGGTPLETLDEKTSAVINSESWTNVTFVLDLAKEVNKSELIFMLDKQLALAFDDFDVKLVEKRANLSDIDTSMVITLLLLKQKHMEESGPNAPWTATGSSAITVVDKVLDESNGYVGEKNGPDSNNYIHFGGRDHNSDQLVYKNKTQKLAPGAYKLTFFARAAETSNTNANMIGGRNPVSVIRIFIGTGWTQLANYSVLSLGSFDTRVKTQLKLNRDWSEFSYTFVLKDEMPFQFWFAGGSDGYGVAPFDIDGFKLVEVNPTNYRPITGENIAIGSDKLLGSKAGWTANDSAAPAKLNAAAKNLIESEFMRVKSNDGETITLTNTGGKVAPGKYYITAKARIGVIDYLKYEFEGVSLLAADNNKAVIKATLGENALKTVSGEDSAEIGVEWSTVTFVIDVTEEVSLKKLKLSIEGAASVDFDYINVDTRINQFDEDSYDPKSGVLPPIAVDEDGNLLEGALEPDRLAYWSYGNQKLEAKTDEDGTPYFAASNITSNTLGFTYNPGFSVKPGTYTFMADVRTSNEGETGSLRVMIGDLYSSALITNEWKTVKFEFTIPDEMEEFSIKLRGGPFATSTQDYEFKNMSLINVISTMKGINLFENGDFNDEEAALATWYYGRSSGKLTVNTEGTNKFLTSSERINCNSATDAKIGYPAFAGVTYKISYDIRTTHEGDTILARGSAIAGGAGTDLNFNGAHFYDITHEWLHVEHTYTPETGGDFILRIAGGWRGEPDDKDFDIDNIRIEIVG